MKTEPEIMIVAGEASGDAHAARLVRALRAKRGDGGLKFFGAAGPHMRAEGVHPTVDPDNFAIVGVPEIAKALPMFLKAFKRLKDEARERRPAVAILVDFPDFNLRLARALKRLEIPVVYYIMPQVWAWRSYRARSLARDADLLLSILPFEKAWFEAKGINQIEYVGNPLAGELSVSRTRDVFCREHSLDPARPIVGLLPGSRQKEIVRILPVMLAAAQNLAEKNDRLQFVLALAHERDLGHASAALDASAIKPLIVTGETPDALNAADAAAIASGTATLEAGIIGTPMTIVYGSSGLNYVLLKPLINVPHYGLINLIAEKRIARELIQGDFTAEALASDLESLLEPKRNAEAREELRSAAEKLGDGGASERAAELILDLIDRRASVKSSD